MTITYHPSLQGGRGRRTLRVPAALRSWLQEHPQAWSGWPTFDAHEPRDQRARLARLEAAGCPGELLRSLPAVNQAVAQLRFERRAKLTRQLARIGLS